MTGGEIRKLAAAIVWKESKMLLIRRKFGPGKGKWGPPGGYRDEGEELKECVIRETEEETGIRIEPMSQFDHLDKWNEDKNRINRIHFFLAEPKGGKLKGKSEECLDAQWFNLKELEDVEIMKGFQPFLDKFKLEREMEFFKDLLKEKFKDTVETSGSRNYRYFHGLNTYKNCKKYLGEKKDREINKKALLVAALFHDIGTLKQLGVGGSLEVKSDKEGFEAYKRVTNPEEDEHVENGIGWVNENLRDCLDSDNLEKVKEIIGEHHEEDPKLEETKVLQDAEEVGRMGPLGVWRMFTYSAFHGHSVEDELKFWKELGLPKRKETIGEMNYSFFQKVGRAKLQRTKKFFSYLEKQIKG